MRRLILPLLLFCSVALAVAEDEKPPIRFPSPDGRFALRIDPSPQSDGDAEIIEKASGKRMVDLGDPHARQVLVWSRDSKWFAYCNRGSKSSEVSVYFWN